MRIDAHGSAGRTRTYACGTASKLLAHVALSGFGRAFCAAPFETEHRKQRETAIGMIVHNPDHSVRAIAGAVAASDAGITNHDFTVRLPHQRIRRAVQHAQWIFAVAA